MKKISYAAALLMVLASVANANLIVKVQPEGDGQSGSARYGSAFGWENVGFSANSTENWSGHWYERSWYSGEQSTVFMQISLADIPTGATIEKADLYLHITECSGSGSQINHRTDASSANGLASQQLAGNVKIADLSAPTGWYSVDVTEYIQSDLDKGHSWAVFSLPPKSYSSLKFSSGDTSDAAYLSVVIPEPATLTILGVGAMTLLRRRK